MRAIRTLGGVIILKAVSEGDGNSETEVMVGISSSCFSFYGSLLVVMRLYVILE